MRSSDARQTPFETALKRRLESVQSDFQLEHGGFHLQDMRSQLALPFYKIPRQG